MQFLIDNLLYAMIPVFGVMLTAIYTFWGKKLDIRADGETKFRSDLMVIVTELRGKIEVFEQENYSLRNESLDLRKQIIHLEIMINEKLDIIGTLSSYYENMPVPAWLKDIDGNMYYINREYEHEHDVTKIEYHGKTDVDVWGKTVGDGLWENDLQVIKSRRGAEFIEEIPLNPRSTETKKWKVWKFPVMRNGEMFGVGGICVSVVDND